MTRKLPHSFYQRSDVCEIAQELLGKRLVSTKGGIHCSGIITETEAYSALRDRACHSFGNRRTKRTEIMFHPGGRAYVYLTYGIHHLFNIVTNEAEKADAVLIRALRPESGVPTMEKRRGENCAHRQLTTGPGKLSQALAIDLGDYGCDLLGNALWIEDQPAVQASQIFHTQRIGINYAGKDALLPWRYYIKDQAYISKK